MIFSNRIEFSIRLFIITAAQRPTFHQPKDNLIFPFPK